jgi:hypothetical protein
MVKRYHQSGHEGVSSAVDKLQQEVGAPRTARPLGMVPCAGKR